MNISTSYSQAGQRDRYDFLKTQDELTAEAAQRPGWKRDIFADKTEEDTGTAGASGEEASAREGIDVVSISQEAKRRYNNLMETSTRRRRAGDPPAEQESDGSVTRKKTGETADASKSAADTAIKELKNQIAEVKEQIEKASQEMQKLEAKASAEAGGDAAQAQENPELETADMAVRELKNKLLQLNEELARAMKENSGGASAGWKLGIPCRGGVGGSGGGVPSPEEIAVPGGSGGSAQAAVDLPGGGESFGADAPVTASGETSPAE